MKPFAEYNKDYKAYKSSQFNIPKNEVDFLLEQIDIQINDSLPQSFSIVDFPVDKIPKTYKLLQKYRSLNNSKEIRTAIEELGYSATNITLSITNLNVSLIRTTTFECTINRPLKKRSRK